MRISFYVILLSLIISLNIFAERGVMSTDQTPASRGEASMSGTTEEMIDAREEEVQIIEEQEEIQEQEERYDPNEEPFEIEIKDKRMQIPDEE